MKDLYLLLGSNQGDSKQYLKQALDKINVQLGKVLKISKIYESEPWGFKAEQSFVNQAVLLKSELEPLEILRKVKNIEKEVGRLPTSSLQYESRIIDIDILLYDSEVFSAKNLHIPHLSFHQRRFALLPVVEISPLFFHPYYNCTMETLLRNCDDNSAVLALE
jgi:2-amino-4-hydroxy-6-hydroxymethyldihydropteridine diphosphokinase